MIMLVTIAFFQLCKLERHRALMFEGMWQFSECSSHEYKIGEGHRKSLHVLCSCPVSSEQHQADLLHGSLPLLLCVSSFLDYE